MCTSYPQQVVDNWHDNWLISLKSNKKSSKFVAIKLYSEFRDKCFLEPRCDGLQKKTYYSCVMAVVSKKAFQTGGYISNEFFSVLRGQSSRLRVWEYCL